MMTNTINQVEYIKIPKYEYEIMKKVYEYHKQSMKKIEDIEDEMFLNKMIISDKWDFVDEKEIFDILKQKINED